MAWNWLHSIFYGLMFGFSSLLPASPEAHERLFQELTGVEVMFGGFRISCRIGVLLALLVLCRKALHRLRQEKRIARLPARTRRRHPDQAALRELRFLCTAAVPAVISTILLRMLAVYIGPLWLLALVIALCGVILYLPPYFRSGNKDENRSSGLDATLTGLSGGICSVPGLAGPAGMLTTASLLGQDRQFAARMCQLLMVILVPVMAVLDVASIVIYHNAVFSMGWMMHYVLSAVTAFGGAYLGIMLLRFLAVRRGYSAFAYYCWALALFIFALYLLI